MTIEYPAFKKNEIRVLMSVGETNGSSPKEALNQSQIAERYGFNPKTFQRGKPKLENFDLLEEEVGGNGGMVKPYLTEKGEKVYKSFVNIQSVLRDKDKIYTEDEVSDTNSDSSNSSISILKRRMATGEIDAEEFREKADLLGKY